MYLTRPVHLHCATTLGSPALGNMARRGTHWAHLWDLAVKLQTPLSKKVQPTSQICKADTACQPLIRSSFPTCYTVLMLRTLLGNHSSLSATSAIHACRGEPNWLPTQPCYWPCAPRTPPAAHPPTSHPSSSPSSPLVPFLTTGLLRILRPPPHRHRRAPCPAPAAPSSRAVAVPCWPSFGGPWPLGVGASPDAGEWRDHSRPDQSPDL